MNPGDHRRRRRQAAARRGRWAETLCAWMLRAKGYAILARSHVTGRGTGAGEIDIVARRGRTVAFVEVKARPDAARAAIAIAPYQRRRLVRGAEAFLARHPELGDCRMRFDAMLVMPWRLPCHLIDAWRDGD